jgi:hypothetical protein
LAVDLTEQLLSLESPYRPCRCVVRGGSAEFLSPLSKAPTRGEMLWNASITHLGALEVIRLDHRNRPSDIVLVPFRNIVRVRFRRRALFLPAQITYLDGSKEVALAPVLYGISWMSKHASDRDGSMTRFCCHLHIDRLGIDFPIGVGHQDFVRAKSMPAKGMHALMGLGSIGEIVVALDGEDLHFEQRCRVLGLRPQDVRAQLADEAETDRAEPPATQADRMHGHPRSLLKRIVRSQPKKSI